MPKRAVSVTLEADNLRWLRGRAKATRARGLSDTLDRLVTEARQGGSARDQTIRSVVGTVEINPEDPGLDRAKASVLALFERSLKKPGGRRRG